MRRFVSIFFDLLCFRAILANGCLADYTANKGLVGMCCGNILLFVLAKLYYIWRNRRLEKQLADLPESEKSRTSGMKFAH